MNPFLLLVIGLILIFLEFYLPGAVMGISGSCLVVASLIVFAVQSGSPLETGLFVVLIVIALIFLVRFALWRIPRSKGEFNIYSNGNQDGFQASAYDASAVGKKGVVLSDLKPGGYILIDGKQHQAISQTGYLIKGTEVLVIGGQEESLIVKPVKKEPSL